jgi:hypothetical protein
MRGPAVAVAETAIIARFANHDRQRLAHCGEAGMRLAYKPRRNPLLLMLGVDGERRQRDRPPRSGLALDAQAREKDVPDHELVRFGD